MHAITRYLEDALAPSAGQPPVDQRISSYLHCTNPHCKNFWQSNHTDPDWCKEHGTYCTKAFGTVQRYRCQHCGKTFSDQSFSIDYWVHRPIDYLPLITALVSTSGQGNLTRFSGVRYEVIQNRYERLSRMFLALHDRLRSHINTEDLMVLDGFESFATSQYFPNNINILTGARSEYIYGMSFAQLRRKGRMSEKQRKRRKELEDQYGRAAPDAVEMAVASLISDLCRHLDDTERGKVTLRTDKHKAYPRALGRVQKAHKNIRHEQYSSHAPRGLSNPLFAVNYVDRQIRKDQVNHVRESVQFARCPAAMMVRLTIYQMYHNYLMPKRVRAQRKGDWQTRGEFLGLNSHQVAGCIREFWGHRVFFHKTNLWEAERMTWFQEWRNSDIPMGRRVPYHIRA